MIHSSPLSRRFQGAFSLPLYCLFSVFSFCSMFTFFTFSILSQLSLIFFYILVSQLKELECYGNLKTIFICQILKIFKFLVSTLLTYDWAGEKKIIVKLNVDLLSNFRPSNILKLLILLIQALERNFALYSGDLSRPMGLIFIMTSMKLFIN